MDYISNTPQQQPSRNWTIIRRTPISVLLSLVVLGLYISPASALSDAQLKALHNQVFYFNAEIDCANQTGSGTTLIGNDNQTRVFNFLKGKGLTVTQAAGIMGNLQVESGMDPAKEEGGGDGTTMVPGVGFGIAQFTTVDKQNGLRTVANNEQVPITDLGAQLDYLWASLSASGLVDKIKATTTTDDAVNQFVGPINLLTGKPAAPTDEVPRTEGYENPQVPHMDKRLGFAAQFADSYGAPGATGAGTTSSNDQSGCAAGSPGSSSVPAGCLTTPPSLTTGTGKFGGGNTTTYRNTAQMLTRACQLADPNSKLFQSVCGSLGPKLCFNFCLGSTAEAWIGGPSGYDTALLMWQAMVAKGLAHQGDRNPPVGALLFYSAGVDGHVVIYLGGNMVMSTDVLNKGGDVPPGYVYITNASAIEDGPWHLPYLGWSPPAYSGYNYQ